MRIKRTIVLVLGALGCSAAGGAPTAAPAASAPHAVEGTRLRATPGSEVLAVGNDGSVALWHSDGRVAWHAKLDGRVDIEPVISLGGTLFVRSANEIVALDGRGARSWAVTTPPPPVGQWDGLAVRADSSLLFVDATGALLCYGREGTRRWRWSPPQPITTAPATAPDSTTYLRVGEMMVHLGVDGVPRWTK